ncbi:MAG: tetratricopeptide repeat protein [Balneolales bacterium]
MRTLNSQNISDKYKRIPLHPYTLIPLYLLMLSGCSTTFQSGWSDFNAYFNTYYNAKTSFERGVIQIKGQEEDINPERPIRIHQTPVQAGRQDFENAIEKSADILRFHPTSRYVDHAIEIIGQSYFYQGQFFSASQKFLELYNTTTNDRKKQNAIYWRGRSFLELESYNEGLIYLKSHLFSSDHEWERITEAHINLVIGQLHVNNHEWDDAEIYLAEGKAAMPDRKLLARANFLHGQVLEELERYEDAFDAYDLAIHNANPEFNITFNARLKKAQVARKMEEYQWAYDYLVSMTRDDKNFAFMGDLLYEIARTLHESGDYIGAQEEYTHLLSQSLSTPTQETTAKTFYGLAEVHKDYYVDYQRAAAYYDSSAQQATDLNKLPEEFDARLLATSYGNYTELVNHVQRLDSLLWLGSLPEAELDSVIANVREENVRKMEQELEDEQNAEDQFTSVDEVEITDAVEDTENGFLNHLNPQSVARVSQTFRALWGSRPLVDDWRRGEAVRSVTLHRSNGESNDIIDEDRSEEEVFEETPEEQNDVPNEQVLVDLSDIPFTEEERIEAKEKLAETYYEIGNVFFLTLNMPDSARSRYYEVLDRFPDSGHAPQAMYSLSETYLSLEDSVNAREIAVKLTEKHPQSDYAKNMAERYNIAYGPEEGGMTRQDSLNQMYSEMMDDMKSGKLQENAEKLKNFAHTYKDSDKAPQALFQAATEYLTLAREDSIHHQRVDEVNQISKAWESQNLELNALKDSSHIMLEDSTLTEEEYQKWSSLADSSLAPLNLDEQYLYKGAYWDSVRVLLADVSENYPAYSGIDRVESIKDEIRSIEEEVSNEVENGILSCDELDARPEIIEDMDQLLAESGIQEQVNTLMVRSTITLMITIDESGDPIDLQSVGKEYNTALMESLFETLKKDVNFSPPTVDGEPVRAACEVHIPVEFQ